MEGDLLCWGLILYRLLYDRSPAPARALWKGLSASSAILDYAVMICHHLSVGRHEKTLETMKRSPRPSNLRWTDVESLLVHFGGVVRERKGSAISVSLNGKRAYFHRPHPDDKADKGAIESALRFLRETGSTD
ncbi:MAG: type II toxin-antitoxin system HicA family toxin [Rectinemataceae bacterium]